LELLSIRGNALKFEEGVFMDENRGYLFAEWKDEEALEYRYNEGRNEGCNMVLELVKQGYTAEQIEAKLSQTTGPQTAGIGD
jgi:hypothetical protein